MTKLLTWTLHATDSATFSTYRKLAVGEPWYSKNYELTNINGMASWDYRKRSFIEMIEKYPEKFYAIGLHEFGVNLNGEVTDLRQSFSATVLNTAKDDIVNGRAVPTSLRYLMHNYPQIKWGLQFLCTSNSSGNRVDPVLDNLNGAQDTFVDHVFHVMKIYLDKGFTNIKTVEIDFEKTKSRPSDHFKFKDLLVRIKNEVCIPLGLELRVNMFAMTNHLTPSYYAWHDYATLASGIDSNGNQAINEFQLMTYDFSWGGSAPGPSTPLWWLEQVLEHVKRLDADGIWKAEDVLIGNAGYGRRWPLGENRYGVTLDYKQLMLAQNGTYIHNPGKTTTHEGVTGFWFNDHDFIPLAGFNDEESDYQRTYLGVYDRFNLSSNGGATSFSGMNRPQRANYVTNYSRKPYPIFNGVISHDFTGTDNFEATGNGNGEGDKVNRINSIGTDTLYVAARASGLDLSSSQHGYATRPALTAPSVNGAVTYALNASGAYRLIALVSFPFFDKAKIDFTINGNALSIDIKNQDWYPFMQAQEKHFVDLGTHDFAGATSIEVGMTNGAQIWGFVACSSFDYNLRGGEVTFPANLQPMKRRDSIINEEVTLKNAQYPATMRLVGEMLARVPRPAIIWEDIFSSYINNGTTVTSDGFNYYTKTNSTNNPGYSIGDWKAYNISEFDYSHAFIDTTDQTVLPSAQLMLNNAFSSGLAIDIEIRGDAANLNAVYGVRALATAKTASSGYACVLDYSTETVRISWEDGISSTTYFSTEMSAALKTMNGNRLRIRVYVLNGKISLWVNDRVYFDRVTMPIIPSGGAYGIYAKNVKLKAYKYNVSSLERYERMERLEIVTNGQTYYFDEVERKPETIYDEYGYINFTGYPAEIVDDVPDIQNPDGSGTTTPQSIATVIDLQVDPNFAWSNDYKNKALSVVPSWQGKQDVIIRFKDAGIWFRNFYVGDNEGMSVAYNSDRIGFIKTANFVADYGCKGIALWTLGQEDPTIYSYIDKGE